MSYSEMQPPHEFSSQAHRQPYEMPPPENTMKPVSIQRPAEMPPATAEIPQKIEIPRFQQDSDGFRRPLDPITGKILSGDTPPESLLADKTMRRGYDFLFANGHRINVDLLLTTHDHKDDLAEAGIDLAVKAQALAEQKGVLFIEGVDKTDNRQQVQQFGHIISNLPEDEDKKAIGHEIITAHFGEDTFEGELWRQIAGSGVAVRHPDYLTDSDKTTDAALTAWHDDLKAMKKSMEAIAADTTRDVGILHDKLDEYEASDTGYVIYRDWTLVGTIGAQLAETFGSARPDTEINAALVAGLLHENIGDHLRRFGATVTYNGAEYPTTPPEVKRFIAGVRNGVALPHPR
jgi:hypothetical protein